MIIVNPHTRPHHTHMEIAVGLGFDILNGRRGNLEIDPNMNVKDVELWDTLSNSNRVFKAISCSTAKEVRKAVELLFNGSVFKRGYSKIVILKGVRGLISVVSVAR